MNIPTLLQVIFWGLLGLWFLGVRFPYMETLIGILAFANAVVIAL